VIGNIPTQKDLTLLCPAVIDTVVLKDRDSRPYQKRKWVTSTGVNDIRTNMQKQDQKHGIEAREAG
jgi:hypothetical protein